MTQLKCSAQTCMYNQDMFCSKGDILVEGKDAKDPQNTCCSSFREKTSNNATNSMLHSSKNIEVECEAVKCTFNENCKCHANEISIGGASACKCQDTECTSFCCKC